MSRRKKDADESGEVEERLSDHPYGASHPLIGQPCLYKGKLPAIPYGAYRVSEGNGLGKGETLLAIAYVPRGDLDKNRTIEVRALSAVHPDELNKVKISSKLAQIIHHTILSWFVRQQ